LIDITLLEEKDAKLKFSRIEAPQKNLYMKLVGGRRGAMETWNCRDSLPPTKWQKKHKLKKKQPSSKFKV
jgi:hypothetical protein